MSSGMFHETDYVKQGFANLQNPFHKSPRAKQLPMLFVLTIQAVDFALDFLHRRLNGRELGLRKPSFRMAKTSSNTSPSGFARAVPTHSWMDTLDLAL